jgi:hypothetical protein
VDTNRILRRGRQLSVSQQLFEITNGEVPFLPPRQPDLRLPDEILQGQLNGRFSLAWSVQPGVSRS